jgi:hypothetical protein
MNPEKMSSAQVFQYFGSSVKPYERSDHCLLFYALYSKTAIPGLFLYAASENAVCTGNRDLAEKKILLCPQQTLYFC